MLTKNRQRCGGWLTAELMAAVAIAAAVRVVLASMGAAVRKVDDRQWLRQTLAAAGQAQLDAMTATGAPIDPETFQRLWPGVDCTMTLHAGEGAWAGLRRVDLRLSAQKRGRAVAVTMSRYTAAEATP